MSDILIRLYARDLYSKWGFMDGDILDYINTDMYVDKHDLLYAVVNEYLKPKLPKDVEIMMVHTSHNPCRANFEDEIECPEKLEDIYVDIPIGYINQIARKMHDDNPYFYE